jgi:hypothetical protein
MAPVSFLEGASPKPITIYFTFLFSSSSLNLFSAGPMDSDTRTGAIDANTSDAPGSIVQEPKNSTQMPESAAPKPKRTPLPTSRPPLRTSQPQPPLPQRAHWQVANGPNPTTFNPETTTKSVKELLQEIVEDTAGDLSTKWYESEEELLELLRSRNITYQKIADVSNFSTGFATKVRPANNIVLVPP